MRLENRGGRSFVLGVLRFDNDNTMRPQGGFSECLPYGESMLPGIIENSHCTDCVRKSLQNL